MGDVCWICEAPDIQRRFCQSSWTHLH